MSYPLPRMSVVLGYKDLFGPPPANRLDLIRHLSKDILILELAGLNYRLSGKLKKEIDTTFETHRKELDWFCGRVPAVRAKYAFLLDKVARGKRTFVFTRQGCLFAMEEISQSDIPVISDFKMNAETWEPLLLYLLAVNDEITHYEDAKEDEPVNFETLSPKMLPLSELLLINDPFYVVHRGLALMDYLAQNEMIKPYLIAYFQQVYGITYDHFIFELHRMWMANRTEPDDLSFYYQVNPKSRAIPLFEALSAHYASDEPQKLLNIRKNPFFKREESHYMLTDLTILLDKAYYQFINDFWFDGLKGQAKPDGQPLKMQDFKSVVGYFFEHYVGDKLDYALKYARGYVVRKYDELKYQTDTGEKEAADLYIRDHHKILLAEVKSTSIYDEAKYGGNIDALYKNNRDKFFKDFGVDQLVESIKKLRANLVNIDLDLRYQKRVQVWPVIVFNERAFQTPLMAQVFQKRFKELLSGFKDPSVYAYPLTLVHISDLERMESVLHDQPGRIWELFSSNFRQQIDFLPPFYITLNRNGIKAKYDRVREQILILFEKYGPEQENHVPKD